MDAQTLRLVLVVLGAVFLIGLYWWETQRADDGEGRARQRPKRRSSQRPGQGSAERAKPRKHEPNLGPVDDDLLSESRNAPDDDGRGLADAPDSGGAAEARPSPKSAPAPAPAADGTRELLIQLFITSPDGAFAGEDILEAAERCRLFPGEMDIFHRTRGDQPDGEPLFSMANLVKPGTFPFQDMTEFSTPGCAIFGQFRGEPSDLMVFDEMLDAARIIAELLDGDVRGPRREHLRDADAGELRARVLALLHGSTQA
jgi:cell division protein ZipA